MALSTTAREALYRSSTTEILLPLLTISHPTFVTPLYFVNNPEPITSRGNDYIGWPFTINFPSDDPDQPPQTQLVLDNVDREVIAAIRGLSSSPTVTLELVLASTPDVVEAGPFTMTLTQTESDLGSISGTLSYDDVLNEPYPKGTFNPGRWPALF